MRKGGRSISNYIRHHTHVSNLLHSSSSSHPLITFTKKCNTFSLKASSIPLLLLSSKFTKRPFAPLWKHLWGRWIRNSLLLSCWLTEICLQYCKYSWNSSKLSVHICVKFNLIFKEDKNWWHCISNSLLLWDWLTFAPCPASVGSTLENKIKDVKLFKFHCDCLYAGCNLQRKDYNHRWTINMIWLSVWLCWWFVRI